MPVCLCDTSRDTMLFLGSELEVVEIEKLLNGTSSAVGTGAGDGMQGPADHGVVARCHSDRLYPFSVYIYVSASDVSVSVCLCLSLCMCAQYVFV